MKIARIAVGDEVWLARVEDDEKAVPLLRENGGPGSDVLRDALETGVSLDATGSAPPLAAGTYQLLAPVRAPEKILAIGLNYADHARESGLEPPSAPMLFIKTTNSIVGPGEAIRYASSNSSQVDYEVELAAVIGRAARNVSPTEALDYVFGYTVCNDVSARDCQFADTQWSRAKSFDTFCPLGPWIVTADEVPDPQNLALRCRVNGQTLQDSTTSEMIFGVAELVSYLSRVMTLKPGDVIATGTPYGVGFARDPQVFLGDGDVVEVEVDGIGTLRSPVVVDG